MLETGCVNIVSATGGNSSIAMYAAIRPIYKKSAQAKYTSVSTKMHTTISLPGSTVIVPRGSMTAILVTMNNPRWASPNQVPTARTAPARTQQKSSAEANPERVSWARATTKIAASERYQLMPDHAIQTPTAIVIVISATASGAG